MISDVGEYIPYAKKDLFKGYDINNQALINPPADLEVNLKTVWPEPDWTEMYLDGLDQEVLANIYAIYHSLARRPHSTEDYTFHDVKIKIGMWRQAYFETVLFIRSSCENAVSMDCIHRLEANFNEKFNVNGSYSYKTYAAGKKTPRHFFRPLGSGPADAYKKVLPLLDWPLSVVADKIPCLPIKLKNGKTGEIIYRLGKINKLSKHWQTHIEGVENKFKSLDAAVATLVKYYEKDFTLTEEERKHPSVYIPKKNPSQIPGVDEHYKDKAATELMTDFGFRGIQFGNYVPQRERQAYINNTYHSLALLCQLIGMPFNWLGGGRLGLSFGARGHGYAAAHYEINLHVINLTRFNGPGAIAHECFHQWDGRLLINLFKQSGLLSDALFNGESDVSRLNKNLLPRVNAFVEIVKACTTDSDFVNNAKNLEKQKGAAKYWSKPSELCARAFEAFIQDRLERIGIDKQWLAFGTKESDYPANGKHPYPTGHDRQRINAVMAKNIPILFGKT